MRAAGENGLDGERRRLRPWRLFRFILPRRRRTGASGRGVRAAAAHGRTGRRLQEHPSNYFTHRPIDAALALREAHGLRGADIARVTVWFPRFEYVDRPQPESGLDGKFSVQYTTALALLDGEIGIDSFTNERRFAPDVVALLPKIALVIDDAIPADFDRMHVIVEVATTDGRTLRERVDRLSGWIGAPLDRAQRLRKFHACARRMLDAAAAERVLAAVDTLDTLPDIAAVMELLRCDGRERA